MQPRSWLPRLAFVVLGAVLGAAGLWQVTQPAAPTPASTLVTQIREVARLETLDVALHKKIVFTPDPALPDGLWHEVVAWAMQALSPSAGRVLVFANAHLSIDLQQLDDAHMSARGASIWLVLPPVQVAIELLPGETEVIGSNLDTDQTLALLEHARLAFARDVAADTRLRDKALIAAQRAIAELLRNAGFVHIYFVPSLPAGA